MTGLSSSAEGSAVSIAVIIAVYNGAKTLERTLDSLAEQTRPADQVIVMDGGSRDGTQALLARREDVATHWRSEPDKGIYDAWNKALAATDADWVMFLGADDHLWDAQVLQRLAEVAAQAPASTPAIYGRLKEIDAAGHVVGERGRPWAECSRRFPFEMTLPHPGLLHRRSICFAAGGFDARYRIAGDYALLRPHVLRHEPLFVDMVVAAAMEGGISTHPARRVESVREVGLAIRAGGDVPPLGWYGMLWKNQLRQVLWRLFGDAGLQRARAAAQGWRQRT